MSIGPVVYETSQVLGPCDEKSVVWAGGSVTLVRGAVIRYIPQATLAAFTKGPGMDVGLFGASPANQQFAGIIADDSVGAVVNGDRVRIITPYKGTIVWCRVAAGLDNGDGVDIQDSATDQGFADGGAYAANDFGVCLLDEDASDNPFGTDNLAPILFTYGMAP